MSEHHLCTMQYVKDEEGREMLLKDGKFQVMMEWEKPYMEACIDILKPFGDVLEIGFGCGYSATHIQSYSPKSHTIIEFHPLVLEKAREWAKNHPNVVLVEGTWQEKISSLGVFDAIFFDDYPLESEQQMQKLETEQKNSSFLLKEGSNLISSVYESYPFIEELQYSDEDLMSLVKSIEQEQSASGEPVARFFYDLHNKNQITLEQREKILLVLIQKGIISEEELLVFKDVHSNEPKNPFGFQKKGDRLFTFLEECLTSHMREGSRFSCFLSDPTSKYEDKVWFDKIITNPFLEYEEKRLAIEVPDHCGYYKASEALVISITKRS